MPIPTKRAPLYSPNVKRLKPHFATIRQGKQTHKGRTLKSTLKAWLFCFFLLSQPLTLFATENDSLEFFIPPSTLDIALNRIAEQAQISIIYDYELVQNSYGHPVIGPYTIQQALGALLKDTPYAATKNKAGIFTLVARSQQATPSKTPSPIVIAEPYLEETLVTGYRLSLQRSLLIKRHYEGIIDVIQAQDIGKFPDANVAEALQRITGVAIERNGGEGQYLTVRGFGPEFNTTLINGRTIATDNQERGFSFDILPAKLISQAQVLKTANAIQQDGSIGANIQLTTPRPFDFINNNDLSHFAASCHITQNSIAQKNTLETFALASHNWQTSHSKVGLLAAIVDSDRSNTTQGYSTEGFRNTEIRVLSKDQEQVNTIQDAYVPRSFRLYQTETEREQTSMIIAAQAQWLMQTGASLNSSIDILSTRFNDSTMLSGFQAYFEDSFLEVSLDENNTATQFVRAGKDTLAQLPDDIRQQLGGSAQGNDSILVDKSRPVANDLYGINLEWDSLWGQNPYQITLDYAYSHAENLTGGLPFSSQGFSATSDAKWTLGTTTQAPSYSFGDSHVTDHPLAAHFLGRFGGNTQDTIREFEITSKWALNNNKGLKAFNAGVLQHRRIKQYTSLETTYPRNCAYCGRHNVFSAETLAALGLEYSDVFQAVPIAADFAGGLDHQAPNAWYQYDIDTLTTILESDAFINAGPIDPQTIRDRLGVTDSFSGIGFDAIELERASYRIAETVNALFGQLDLEGQWGSLLWSGNIGARYSTTETIAQGTQAKVASIVRASDDDQLDITYLPDQSYTNKHRYHHVLPSVNFSFNPSALWHFRFSSSKTITRPNLYDLGQEARLHPRAGSAIQYQGNPNLLPYESINTDLAAEWYFKENSFVGINLFYKSISHFVSAGSQSIEIDGTHFTQIQPTNQESANANGLEFALQHTFLSGWGLQANYTYTASSAQFFIDETNSGTQTFAIEGLSPTTYNLIGFYENSHFSARASFNWRQEYLRAVVGAQSQPESAQSYGQLDVNLRYHITPHLSVFAEGTNVLKEETRLFSIYKNRVIKNEHTGARYLIGMSAKF